MKKTDKSHSYSVVIIGAGFAGLIAARELMAKGIHDFILIEKAKKVGGVWRETTYPGCACDIPSYLYSIKDYPSTHWSQKFAAQSEILDYLHKMVREMRLEDKIKFETDVKEMIFDRQNKIWQITDQKDQNLFADHVILATGALNVPNKPSIQGASDYQGEEIHTANWNSNVTLEGKRVGVVGTGASAIQLIPHLADKVASLHVFQRSAPWVLPRNNHNYSSIARWVLKYFPGLHRLYRSLLYRNKESWLRHFKAQDQLYRRKQKQALVSIKKTVQNKEVVEKLTPDYELGCKRILFSDDYYPSFNKQHVQLHTDRILEMNKSGFLLDNHQEIPLDLIVWATGYMPNAALSRIKIMGLGRLSLIRTWLKYRPKIFKGVAVHGFPQLHFLCGPNTGLAHNSVLLMFEAQMKYIVQSIQASQVHTSHLLDVKSERQEEWFDDLQEALDNTVWNKGNCQSWYLNAKGKNYSLYPYSVDEYQKACNAFSTAHYNLLDPEQE